MTYRVCPASAGRMLRIRSPTRWENQVVFRDGVVLSRRFFLCVTSAPYACVDGALTRVHPHSRATTHSGCCDGMHSPFRLTSTRACSQKFVARLPRAPRPVREDSESMGRCALILRPHLSLTRRCAAEFNKEQIKLSEVAADVFQKDSSLKKKSILSTMDGACHAGYHSIVLSSAVVRFGVWAGPEL